ncbi:hypothetical protein HDU79_003914 [Rhizoclosmatium sp. JEL0117]|nr:hypothetical protein HDU79_003914 [Rhizoclosmatium sp. JEL0117]
MIAMRLVFAVGGGAASSMLVAVLADYAEDRFRGRMAGLVGLCSGCGALLALFLFMPLPLKFDYVIHGLQATYLIEREGLDQVVVTTSSIDLARNSGDSMDVTSETYLVSPNQSGARGSCPVMQNLDQDAVTITQIREDSPLAGPKSVWQTAKEGILAAKDPKVLLGYVGSFLARGDTVIITLFIPLWVYKRYIDLGQCTVSGPEDPDIRDVCAAAFKRASAISGVAQTFALVGAPLFGFLADRFHASNVVLFNALLGLISYLFMFYADPIQAYVFAIVIFVGLSEIGLVIGNISLVTNSKSVDKSIRGSVAGVSSACGAVGILLSSKLGGWLFDHWREGAPFLVLAVGHLLAVICGFHRWRWTQEYAAILLCILLIATQDILACSTEGSLLILNTSSKKTEASAFVPSRLPATCIALIEGLYGSEKTLAAVGDVGGSVSLWNTETLEMMDSPKGTHRVLVSCQDCTILVISIVSNSNGGNNVNIIGSVETGAVWASAISVGQDPKQPNALFLASVLYNGSRIFYQLIETNGTIQFVGTDEQGVPVNHLKRSIEDVAEKRRMAVFEAIVKTAVGDADKFLWNEVAWKARVVGDNDGAKRAKMDDEPAPIALPASLSTLSAGSAKSGPLEDSEEDGEIVE